MEVDPEMQHDSTSRDSDDDIDLTDHDEDQIELKRFITRVRRQHTARNRDATEAHERLSTDTLCSCAVPPA